MNARALAGALLLVLALPAAARAAAQPVPLDRGWEYRADPGNTGVAAGWAAGDAREHWDGVELPHVFTATPVDELFGGTVGWYRTTIVAPDTPPGWTWGLRLEGARRSVHGWLDGRDLGQLDEPYAPAELPLPPLGAGERHVLVLRVDNLRHARLREGWWNWGGLTRAVSLAPHAPVGLEDLAVLPDVRCPQRRCSAAAVVDAVTVNHTANSVRPALTLDLWAPTRPEPGGAVAAQSAAPDATRTITLAPLAPGTSRHVRMRLPVHAPRLWSPQAPRHYRARVRLAAGGTLYEDRAERVGLRSVTVKGGRILLNGRQLRVYGASVVEDLPGRGPALRPQDADQIVNDLRAVGARITRAHYLLNPEILRRLDDAGILVWSQAPIYHSDIELRSGAGRARALTTLRRTVLEARRHASVIAHSVANELAPEPDRTRGTRAYLLAAARLAKRLDPSVLTTVDLLTYPRIPRQHTYLPFDALGLNSYYGWYLGKPGIRSTADLGDLAPYLRSMRRKYPAQGFAITEFGAEATYDGPRDVKETFAFQAEYVRKTLDIADRFPWLGATLYWTVREFYVKPDWDGGAKRANVRRDALHNKGLLRYDGTPKPAWNVARERFLRAGPFAR